MGKKYEFTGATRNYWGMSLHRIRALRDIPLHGVHAGDIGGWIGSSRNLSHGGSCWVSDEALVGGSTWVEGDVLVFSEVILIDEDTCGLVSVSERVRVYKKAFI